MNLHDALEQRRTYGERTFIDGNICLRVAAAVDLLQGQQDALMKLEDGVLVAFCGKCIFH